jgi:WD40 repeat protein
VWSAAFSHDGPGVVTASEDHTARVWDAATGKLLATPLQHQGPVRSAAFSPDGSRVVTVSLDHTARIWETPLDDTASAGWAALAARSPFELNDGVLVRRVAHALGTGNH